MMQGLPLKDYILSSHQCQCSLILFIKSLAEELYGDFMPKKYEKLQKLNIQRNGNFSCHTKKGLKKKTVGF